MTVLNVVPLSGRKTISVEAPRINDLEEVGILTAPLETSRVARRRLGRSEYFVRGATVSAVQRTFFVGYAQGPDGGFLMTRLGPVCITPPRAAVHTANGWGIGLTLGLGNISDPHCAAMGTCNWQRKATRRETKELTEKSHWGIV
jgi:hypothetical protein